MTWYIRSVIIPSALAQVDLVESLPPIDPFFPSARAGFISAALLASKLIEASSWTHAKCTKRISQVPLPRICYDTDRRCMTGSINKRIILKHAQSGREVVYAKNSMFVYIRIEGTVPQRNMYCRTHF